MAESCKFHVYLSFRGEDTRYGFTSHLYSAFRRKGINAFIDENLKKGNDLNVLFERIEQSKIVVVIFSEKYADSSLCLEELTKSLECMKNKGQVVIPVFYKVTASQVKHQKGRFGRPFERPEVSFRGMEDKVPVWKEALTAAAELEGHKYDANFDAKLVENVVRDVCQKLFPAGKRNQIGINLRVQKLKAMLLKQASDVRSIGIWGMEGIGKTTIAKAIYDNTSPEYDACYFLTNFDKRIRERGLHSLQEDFLAKDILRSKKILLVLDDVCNFLDAETLVGGFDSFGRGSTIIITSRDRNVLLQCRVNEIYEAEALNEHESRELLSQRVVGNDNPQKDLLKQVVDYAQGNPLVLEILGSFLSHRRFKDWEKVIQKVGEPPMCEILNILRSSYDALDDDEKNIFLDMACFFNGENVDRVMDFLDGCGFFARVGVGGLIDKSLIKIPDNKIEMHKLIQAMGREIVNEESVEPENRSRLWDPNQIRDVLEGNKGTEAVEGIVLDASNSSFNVSPMAFNSMFSLRLLKIHYSNIGNHCELHLPKDPLCLPDELRLLHWESYPWDYLPKDFDLRNLVELSLPRSQIQNLGQELLRAQNLMYVDLSGCSRIDSFPELSPNIKELYLGGTGIKEVPYSIRRVYGLVKLDLENCRELKILPTTICELKSLKHLNLTGCSNLESFPEISRAMKSLLYLYLSETAIADLPSSISNLIALEELSLKKCKNLSRLPNGLWKLKKLKKVEFDEIVFDRSLLPFISLFFLASTPYSLEYLQAENKDVLKIPGDIHDLAVLTSFDLIKNETERPFYSIEQLLKSLSLSSSEKTQSPSQLLQGETHMETMSGCSEQAPKRYIFNDSSELEEDLLKETFSDAFARVQHMEKQHLQVFPEAPSITICLPTGVHPEWSKLVTAGYSAILSLPRFGRKYDPTGFAYFIVVSIKEDCNNADGFAIRCISKLKSEGGEHTDLERVFGCWCKNEGKTRIKQDMMLMFYDYSMLPRLCEGGDLTTFKAEIAFEFYPVDENNRLLGGYQVKECAVYMLTAEHKDHQVVLKTSRSSSSQDLKSCSTSQVDVKKKSPIANDSAGLPSKRKKTEHH